MWLQYAVNLLYTDQIRQNERLNKIWDLVFQIIYFLIRSNGNLQAKRLLDFFLSIFLWLLSKEFLLLFWRDSRRAEDV